jgi:predicted DCC family thiol-disulfide oxidoreductase YuxK
MTNGWTGGQYSLYRAILGLSLLVHFVVRLSGLPVGEMALLSVAGAIASACLLVGFGDRAAAAAILLVLLRLAWPHRIVVNTALVVVSWLLAAHLFVPPSPYGSWSARHRSDPRGTWRMPWPTMVCFFHLFVINPGWVPGRWPDRRDHLFYDGTCGLCHRAIRFVIAEDRRGTAFTFAAIGGETFTRAIGAAEHAALGDSMIVRAKGGMLLSRSDAVLYILERLGGWWRVLAAALRLVPRAVRDLIYDAVARIRYRLFARPATVCPVLAPDLRSRFRD